MQNYNCDRCGYESNRLYNFRKHLLRQHKCKPILANVSVLDIVLKYNIDVDINKFNTVPILADIKTISSKIPIISSKTSSKIPIVSSKTSSKIPIKLSSDNESDNEIDEKNNKICKKCCKTLSSYKNRWRHEKTCKGSIQKDILYAEVEKIFNELSKKQKTNKTINSNNNNNNTNSNNITVNNFGSENIDYITKKVIKHILSKPNIAIPLMIKEIHFNDNHPENQNVQITNYQRPYGKIKTNGKWNLVKKKELLTDITDNTQSIFEEYNDTIKLKDTDKKMYNIFDNNYDTNKDNIIKDVELMIVNESLKI